MKSPFRWLLFFSHPADYTPVCTTELGTLIKMIPEFEKRNAKIITLSCDDVDSHNGWSKVCWIHICSQVYLYIISCQLSTAISYHVCMYVDTSPLTTFTYHSVYWAVIVDCLFVLGCLCPSWKCRRFSPIPYHCRQKPRVSSFSWNDRPHGKGQ